jgi:Zn-dependent metalloprotease
MQTITHSPPLCSVIPPHILRHIAASGNAADSATRAGASETLAQMKVLARRSPLVRTRQAKPKPLAGKRRNVYDAGHVQRLPGKLVMSETTARSKDVEVGEAYDGAGKTYDFYAQVFGRNSIDGRGLRLASSVHYGRRFENAFWNGEQMVYGDGDGKLFNRFTAALDVIGHELTHGVTQYTAKLGYSNQTGALNEHISDAFGIMVKQWALGLSARDSDWIIGEGLFGPTVNGKGIRSMAAPGTAYDDPVLGRDPQPAHMSGYVETTDDNGGVHINSGIPNHAFYLAATALGGPAWEVAGQVWYESLSHLSITADFQAFASTTFAVAGLMFGMNGPVQRAVQEAWLAVGLTPVAPRSARSVRRPPKPWLRAAVKILKARAAAKGH